MIYIKLSLLSLFCFILPHVCFSNTNLNDLPATSSHAAKIVDDEKVTNKVDQIQKPSSYFSIHAGRTISHNSKEIISSIKKLSIAIIGSKLEKFKFFVDVDDILKSIDKCEAKTDLQWLGSAALGYYIGNNGRFEFEATYFQGIMNSNANALRKSIQNAAETIPVDKALHEKVNALNCSGKISMYTLMPNLYYNFNIKNTLLSPYVGFGVGIMGAKLTFDKSDDNTERAPLKLPWVAYQAKLGFNYPLTSKAKISFGYRYFNIPLPEVDNNVDSIASHSIEAGLIFDF